MFTGIIETIGTLHKKRVDHENKNHVIEIQSSLSHELVPSQSISHNGVCLTVENIHEECYTINIIPETLKKTMLGQWEEGDLINIERALLIGERLDGHFVQGHVDTIGTIIEIHRQGEKHEIIEVIVEYPASYRSLIAEKGSITLHGISLTIAKINSAQNNFSVCIIPHTYRNTNISKWEKNSPLNIEFDILAKHVQNFIGKPAIL